MEVMVLLLLAVVSLEAEAVEGDRVAGLEHQVRSKEPRGRSIPALKGADALLREALSVADQKPMCSSDHSR